MLKVVLSLVPSAVIIFLVLTGGSFVCFSVFTEICLFFVTVAQKSLKVYKLSMYEWVASSRTFLFLKSSRRSVCVRVSSWAWVISFPTTALNHCFLWGIWSVSTPIPSLHRALPPTCSHAKSWNMSWAVRGGGWKQEGLLDWCPRVWLWVALPLGRKWPEKIVNSSHFIHEFMNADICAFQSCDCCSVYLLLLLAICWVNPCYFCYCRYIPT